MNIVLFCNFSIFLLHRFTYLYTTILNGTKHWTMPGANMINIMAITSIVKIVIFLNDFNFIWLWTTIWCQKVFNYVHVYQTQWPFIISMQESTYIVTPASIYILVYHVLKMSVQYVTLLLLIFYLLICSNSSLL